MSDTEEGGVDLPHLQNLANNIACLQLVNTLDPMAKRLVDNLAFSADQIKQDVRRALLTMVKKEEPPSSNCASVEHQPEQRHQQELTAKVVGLERELAMMEQRHQQEQAALQRNLAEVQQQHQQEQAVKMALEGELAEMQAAKEALERELALLRTGGADGLKGKDVEIVSLHAQLKLKTDTVEQLRAQVEDLAASRVEVEHKTNEVAMLKGRIRGLEQQQREQLEERCKFLATLSKDQLLDAYEHAHMEARSSSSSKMGGGGGGSGGGGPTRKRKAKPSHHSDDFAMEQDNASQDMQEEQEEEEEEEESFAGGGGSAGEEEEEEGEEEDDDDEESNASVTELARRKKHRRKKTKASVMPPAQQAMVRHLAELLYHQIPNSYRTTIEGCLHVVFAHASFAGASYETLDALKAAVRALPLEMRSEFVWQVRAKPHHKQCMQRIFAYLLDDTTQAAAGTATAGMQPAVMDVTGEIYLEARKQGLGLGEDMFRKVLGTVLPPAALPSMEAFKARMQEDETRQRFIELYDGTTDNPKKGVICRIFDAAGLDGKCLMRANRPKAVPEGFAARPVSSSSSSSSCMPVLRRPAVSFTGVEPMSPVERQIYDKVRGCGLNLYEAVFRKVLADKMLPESALESVEAFTAHMRKGETQAQFLDYSINRCDNQKKGVVAMLFTAAGIDSSFLKAVNRKKTVARGMPFFSMPPTTARPPPTSSSSSGSSGVHARPAGGMDMLTQAAAAAEPVPQGSGSLQVSGPRCQCAGCHMHQGRQCQGQKQERSFYCSTCSTGAGGGQGSSSSSSTGMGVPPSKEMEQMQLASKVAAIGGQPAVAVPSASEASGQSATTVVSMQL